MANPIGVDASGYEVLTKAVAELLNQFPGLDDRIVTFEDLGATSGIAFAADSGALVMTERRNILDHVTQTCQFPFFVVYRSASTRAAQKINIQTFLDSIGKWICGEKAEVDGELIQLESYPALAQGRKITKVTRGNSYGTEPDAKGVQDWLLPVTIEYTNEFDDNRKG